MTELEFFRYLTVGFIGLSVVVFSSLLFITAPYGRHTRPGWGLTVNNRLAWILMEAPASLLMIVYYFTGKNTFEILPTVFLIIWQCHYFQRAFIFPFSVNNTKRMPALIMSFGIIFNTVNTYIQGRWLFHLVPSGYYPVEWLWSGRFIIGLALFAAGFYINRKSDAMLIALKKSSNGEYQIPRGWLYESVSNPNYLGELIIWIGWAVLTWSWAGVVFVVWTAANLIPRALSNHKWYQQKFPDYPAKRKSLIPYIF